MAVKPFHGQRSAVEVWPELLSGPVAMYRPPHGSALVVFEALIHVLKRGVPAPSVLMQARRGRGCKGAEGEVR